MGEDIQIELAVVNTYAQEFEELSQGIDKTLLYENDTQTTISANQNGRNAYETSQALMVSLGAGMEQEAANIRGLGQIFKTLDEELADGLKG